MPLSLRSTSSTRSPISEVSYDILREIFAHCFPRYPLQTMQPDTTVAPMLLCQICSSWRAVALASPSLWSRLRYCFTTQCADSKPGSWVFRQKEIDFIMWWKGNQGSMATFLRLDIVVCDVNQDFSPAEGGLTSVQQYMTSAQYLQIELFDSSQLRSEVEFGDALTFSNLHTLVMVDPQYSQDLLSFVLARTPSLLRRLAIEGQELAEKPIVSKHWSALTHLTTDNVIISLNSWFSLIRAVPDLQWAYITFAGIFNTGTHTVPPAKYVHRHLSTLFMTYAYNVHQQGDDLLFPLTLIFSSLYLPALHTLSLASTADSWKDHRAISELYTILQTAPAVTTLTLRGPILLFSDDIDYPTTLAAIGDVGPIWGYLQHLTHLRLELPDVDPYAEACKKSILNEFVCNIFLSNHSWLALEPPTCPVQKITLIYKTSFNPDLDEIKKRTMSSIRKYSRGVSSNVAFKFISQSEDDTGAAEWKEWGSIVC